MKEKIENKEEIKKELELYLLKRREALTYEDSEKYKKKIKKLLYDYHGGDPIVIKQEPIKKPKKCRKSTEELLFELEKERREDKELRNTEKITDTPVNNEEIEQNNIENDRLYSEITSIPVNNEIIKKKRKRRTKEEMKIARKSEEK